MSIVFLTHAFTLWKYVGRTVFSSSRNDDAVRINATVVLRRKAVWIARVLADNGQFHDCGERIIGCKNDLTAHRNAACSFRFVNNRATARGFASVEITAHPGTINSYIICKLWLMIIIIFDSNVTNVTFATLIYAVHYS